MDQGWIKDGSRMSFADLLKMKDGKEKDEIIAQFWRADKIRFKEYELQVANQRIEEMKWVAEVANQTEKKIDKGTQAVIKEVIALDMSNIWKMEKILSLWKKLNADNKKYLEVIVASKRPPVDAMAKRILDNPQNFE